MRGDSCLHRCPYTFTLLQPLHQQRERGGPGEGGNKWRSIQTGRGCNFLRKLSEPFPVWPIRGEKKESMTERRRRGGKGTSVSVRNITDKRASRWTFLPLGSAFAWDEKERWLTPWNSATKKCGTEPHVCRHLPFDFSHADDVTNRELISWKNKQNWRKCNLFELQRIFSSYRLFKNG